MRAAVVGGAAAVARAAHAPCDASYPCGAACFCGLDDALCGVGVTCCQARVPLGGDSKGDWTRCELGLHCQAASIAPCEGGASSCCVEAGALGGPCHWPDMTCEGPGVACSAGRGVEAGGSGEPCVAGGCSESGLACVYGYCRETAGARGIGASCPSGSRCHASPCVATRGPWQECDATGDACDSTSLACQAIAVAGPCSLPGWSSCCQPL